MLFKLFVLMLSISFGCNTVSGMALEDDSLEGDQETVQVSCLVEKLKTLSFQLEDYKEQRQRTAKKKRKNTKSKNQKQMLQEVLEFFESNKKLFQNDSSSLPKIREIFAKLKNHEAAFTGKVNAPFNLQELINDLLRAVNVINAHIANELAKTFDDESLEHGDESDLEEEQVLSSEPMRQDEQLLDNLQACNDRLQAIVQHGGLDDYLRVLIAVFAIGCTAFAIYLPEQNTPRL